MRSILVVKLELRCLLGEIEMFKKLSLIFALILFCTSLCYAQPTLDGSLGALGIWEDLSINGDLVATTYTGGIIYTILDDPNDNAQITAAQCNGTTVITNDGAGAARTYVLPIPAAGLVCMAYLEEAQDVDLDPNSSYQIFVLTDSAGDKISSDATQGSCIKLIAHDNTGWWPYGRVGAWTDAN